MGQVGKGTKLGYGDTLIASPTYLSELNSVAFPGIQSGMVPIEDLEGEFERRTSDQTKTMEDLNIVGNMTEDQYFDLKDKVGDTDIWTWLFPSGGKAQIEAVLTKVGGNPITRKGIITNTFTLSPTCEEVDDGVIIKYTPVSPPPPPPPP